MNTIMTKRLTLLTMSMTFFCRVLCANESIEQQASALISKPNLPQLIQMYEQAIQSGTTADRVELSKTIINHINRDDVLPVVKGELLTMLGRFGGPESVDFFASLLSHEDPLFHTRAVLALQRNASEKAAEVLRKALASASEPEKRAIMIHALSVRGDRASLPQFIKDAGNADDVVRTAALLAVARMSDEPANALFKAGMKQGPARAKREATDAYLLHADRLVKTGKKQESLAIYHELLGNGGYVKANALMGMARVGGAAELTAILENLKGAERNIINITDKLFEHIPKSGPVITAVCENVKSADPILKIRLLDVLGWYADPAGLDTVLDATKDANEAVRNAAVNALGRFDDKRAFNALVATLATGKEMDAAVMAVETSPRKAIIADGLIAALPGTSGLVCVSLVRALGTCPAGKATPILLKTMENADATVRNEVFNALRKIGDPSAYPDLVKHLAVESDHNVQSTAVNALASLGVYIKEPSQRSAPVLAQLATGSSSPGRPALLLLLPRISSKATQEAELKFLREALSEQDENLRRAAMQAMTDWPDPDPVLDTLLQTSKKEPQSAFSVVALRAYVKQIGALIEKRNVAVPEKQVSADDVQKEIIQRCIQGLEIAVQPAEKMGFLSYLGQQPHPDALKVVEGYLNDQNVKTEAIQAALSIATVLHKTHADMVKPVLEKIKTVTDDKQLQSKVDQLLKTMKAKK
ncbi:MAG: HEAT repeat domain-containing protein [Kiritimatiellae bacterium]|nr:HEAT repeat domain-containing protein [Kiritimatiellia bacterium]MDD5519729.1 HEAT repeat domain-containing protein [Kiritimatiellia bacterium]